MVKKNYKSDFELIYTLLDSEGNEMQVPDNPWELWLSCGNPLGANGRKFIASYDGSAYRNCEVRDNNIIVYADNHHLPTGVLWTTFVDYQPNLSFADGDKTIYTPQPTNVELVSGAGDEPTETDIEILANYVVFEHEYTAGQGITIENDVISATGESYTAGEGIAIDNGTIGLDTATQTAIASIADKASKDELQNVLDVLTSDIADVAQDVQSVETELQEKADNTEIDRVIAIINNDEHGLPSKADVSDVTALGNRVTAVEGSITDLTTGNNPALRASDKTTEKQIGKVAEYEDSRDTYLDPTTHQPIPQAKVPLLNTGDLYLDGVFRAGMDNKYALPHEGDEVKLRADYVLADEADVTSLSQTVATKADASDVQSLSQTVSGKADQSDLTALGNRVSTIEGDYVTDTELAPISQDVNTLTQNYNSIVNALNQEITELIEGKAMIASALTDRGYPTAPTDSSASMAQKIENMEYDAGWLAQLGYTEDNDGGVKDAVAYSKSIEAGWDAQVTNRNFQNDTKLVFCPRIDTSRYTSMNNFFAGSSLIFMKENDIDMSSVTTAQGMFSATRIAVIPPLSTPLLSGMYLCFNGASVRKIMSLDLSSMPTPSFGSGVVNTDYCVLKNIGKVSNFNWNEANMSNWGNYSEDNRQSLVKTLRDYSFDRVTAGYSACTIKLHADTLARLTAEEIAAITAKGFTLTS